MSSSAVVATPSAVPKGGEDSSVHTPHDGAITSADPSKRQKDLYAQLKALQKRLEFLNIQVSWFLPFSFFSLSVSLSLSSSKNIGPLLHHALSSCSLSTDSVETYERMISLQLFLYSDLSI